MRLNWSLLLPHKPCAISVWDLWPERAEGARGEKTTVVCKSGTVLKGGTLC